MLTNVAGLAVLNQTISASWMLTKYPNGILPLPPPPDPHGPPNEDHPADPASLIDPTKTYLGPPIILIGPQMGALSPVFLYAQQFAADLGTRVGLPPLPLIAMSTAEDPTVLLGLLRFLSRFETAGMLSDYLLPDGQYASIPGDAPVLCGPILCFNEGTADRLATLLQVLAFSQKTVRSSLGIGFGLGMQMTSGYTYQLATTPKNLLLKPPIYDLGVSSGVKAKLAALYNAMTGKRAATLQDYKDAATLISSFPEAISVINPVMLPFTLTL